MPPPLSDLSLADIAPDVPTTKAPYRALRQQAPYIAPISATSPAGSRVVPTAGRGDRQRHDTAL
jgi:hypothetical protein